MKCCIVEFWRVIFCFCPPVAPDICFAAIGLLDRTRTGSDAYTMEILGFLSSMEGVQERGRERERGLMGEEE